MKKLISILLIFFCGIQIISGQNNNDQPNSWDKIVIADLYGGWSNFDNRFQINNDFSLTSLSNPDSIIKKVDPRLISEIVILLNNNNLDTLRSPLSFFGKDSLWIIQNAELLWKEYRKKWKASKEIDAIAINTIKDIEKVNKAAWTLQGSHWTDDYPLVGIQIITKKDTLSAYSNGQYPYMLPWQVKGQKVYNSRISEIIAELLPDIATSNKERLSGKNFNSSLISKIYNSYIKVKENYLEARDKYPGSFQALEKEFLITKAEIVDMSSIEWGGIDGNSCLEMSLKDTTISKNIEFHTIFGMNKLFNSPKSILKNKDKLIHSLDKNPIHNYTLSCDNCLGEIHWVKTKSLSKEAEKTFKEDLADNGLDKNKYNGKYKNAIFYELTENRNGESSFSRWIFLKDGTVILWQLRGNYLMDFPKEFIENQGYICKEIEF